MNFKLEEINGMPRHPLNHKNHTLDFYQHVYVLLEFFEYSFDIMNE